MYQGELRKYDPAELSAYFKGADRLYSWIHEDIQNLEKRRISIDKLLRLMDYWYLYWYSSQTNFGLAEEDEEDQEV